MRVAHLRHSWELVARHGDQVPLFFYSTLFLAHPETRDMFPIWMSAQRDKLVTSLGRIVSQVDDLDALAPYLQQMGRDHRKFAVDAEHYPAVGAALLATLEHFMGAAWNPKLAADWGAAFGLVAKVMSEAAEESAVHSPPWWEAEVVSHERRAPDIAVLTLAPDHPLRYLPGQAMAVESPLRPRMWRYYTPANAPREDGTIDLHVRAVPGGPVSGALVLATRVGDTLRLGAPIGDRLTLDARQRRNLLLIAGGTGLAPFKALIEQVAAEHAAGLGQRRVHLFFGTRQSWELYDRADLQRVQAAQPWLSVVPCVSHDSYYEGQQGSVVEVAMKYGPWPDHDIYVCGSSEMVEGSLAVLSEAGVPDERVRCEAFSGDGPYGPREEWRP